ncbi:MAG: bifunctional DNA-formamidopyrimidine glycosylase/DNA-(apurinic or apyrimidinic site) lyase [Planctomycetota bacterium]|nr:MAG: bifunctional DNA-formamidopyrimidine glycosylase/DNA-(apurinic or apyrimidinic site) lyase [Planctomycetota bacterium]
MPELPEVETMVRGIRPTLEGARLMALEACPCACRPLTIRPGLPSIVRQVVGHAITRVVRRAKRIVMQFDTGSALVIEPRMTGLMLVSEPPNETHLRLVWTVQHPSDELRQVWFWDQRGLGTVSLYSPEEVDRLFRHGQLGPDALEMTLDHWRVMCSATHRPIKVALLDQHRVAGIGNLYASEILHLSRIHPETPADELTLHQRRRMADSTTTILNEAIRYEGSTLGDGTYRNALNQSGGYQNSHRVYAREGETCPTCHRTAILRIVQAQRSTFYCPRCQRS